ncbi:MAG: efflux RND transporter periplasmic adaptor subunit [Bacteroidota bacterium]
MKLKYLLFCSVLFLACKENYIESAENKGKVNLPTVKMVNLTLSNEPIPIEASGMIGAKAEVNLSFKLGGIIQQLYAEETQYVRKGQLLASLRTNEIDAQVLKAQQAVQKAERDLVRIKKMFADTAATLENVEDLTTQLKVAQSDLDIAQFNQQYAKIVAPVSGKVLKKFVENNELISPGAPVYRIATNKGKGYILKIGVADKDVIRIKLGDRAEVHLDAYPDAIFEANVTEIAEAADPRTGVFPVEITLKSQKERPLRNGFIGKVKLLPSRQANYHKIPMSALVEGYREKANIYTLHNGKVTKISVRPAFIGDDFFTISEGKLADINEVITEGAAFVKEGMEVEVIR